TVALRARGGAGVLRAVRLDCRRGARHLRGGAALEAHAARDVHLEIAVADRDQEDARAAAAGIERRRFVGGSMSVVKEFKEFAVQGSVMDLAVGIVIGAAFKSIVDSFVADILTPLIGLVTGGIDFTNRFIVLGAGHFATLEEAKK